MKTACCLSILLIIFSAGLARGSEGQDDEVLRLGVSPNVFEGINENDLGAALKAWASSVGSEMGLDKVDVTLINGVAEFRAALDESRLDGVSVSVAEYMDLGLKLQDVYLTVTEKNDPGISYVVIAGKDAGISGPEDLPGRRLVMGNDRRMGLAQPWLQMLMTNRHQGPDGIISREPEVVENPSKAILQVFFHQADAALVVSEAFDLACELNPQLRTGLKVIAESPSFIIGCFLFPQRPDTSLETEKLKNAILDLSSTPGGRQVLTVFKSSRIERFSISALDNTIQFLTDYRSMINEVSSPETRP